MLGCSWYGYVSSMIPVPSPEKMLTGFHAFSKSSLRGIRCFPQPAYYTRIFTRYSVILSSLQFRIQKYPVWMIVQWTVIGRSGGAAGEPPKHNVLVSHSLRHSTIGDAELNCRVQNGIGLTLRSMVAHIQGIP